MKKLLLFIAIFIATSCYSQDTIILKKTIKGAVKEGVREVYKELNPIKPTKESVIAKIKPDTITTIDKNKTWRLMKMEVKNYYYVVELYSVQEDKPYIYYKKIDSDTPFAWKTSIYGNSEDAYSLITIPFKIRPRNGSNPSIAKGGLDNIGFFYSPLTKTSQKLFFDNKTSKKVHALGLFIAPTVEEIELMNDDGTVDKSNQFYMGAGVAYTYTYNKISVALILGGVDVGMSEKARRWGYDGKYWWGFGLAIDTDLLSFVSN